MFSVACDYLQYAMAIAIICRKCQNKTPVNILVIKLRTQTMRKSSVTSHKLF